MKKNIFIIIVLILTLLLAACSTDNSLPTETEAEEIVEEVSAEEEEKEEEAEDLPEEIDLAVIQPNEAGEIMVLMYHHITEPEAEWSRTPDNFRRDLQNLYDNGYRPISLVDYTTGNITTEAGYTPVVFTFDDGNQNNFNMIEDDNGEWVIDPDSAVGILVDFHEKHPDFPLEATFFINGGTPFGQAEWVEYKLNYIVDNGMDIGNHTYTHINFTNASADKIQEELGRLNSMVKQYLPDYEVNTLALPFGSKPKNTDLYRYVIEGEYQGENYHHIAILEVGWDPYRSPFHKDFDGTRIRRVRASETKVDGVGMYDWMRALDSGSRLRYISDGDPNTVTVPEKYRDRLPEEIEGKIIRTYTLD
ncbi:Polysaccharide deacetylase [Natronincola peptidivorans]|uniref:Polysaccharide deacetylase n=1 Tax=Natronincola peptidivorans TaxID=426128 RepID=A0A1I0H1V8_9FIRM|nr:polysaccharide deacetylase family protein [Natronincola peptidivorans]SET77472.1 Polysaccharide deacetylase [Natronincola peptidivorans]